MAKDGLQDQLRNNNVSREEKRVRAAEDVILILYDHNSDSESSDTSSEPASSSSKESTLPAEHTNDNEETPLKITSFTMDIQKRSFRYNQEVIFHV